MSAGRRRDAILPRFARSSFPYPPLRFNLILSFLTAVKVLKDLQVGSFGRGRPQYDNLSIDSFFSFQSVITIGRAAIPMTIPWDTYRSNKEVKICHGGLVIRWV